MPAMRDANGKFIKGTGTAKKAKTEKPVTAKKSPAKGKKAFAVRTKVKVEAVETAVEKVQTPEMPAAEKAETVVIAHDNPMKLDAVDKAFGLHYKGYKTANGGKKTAPEGKYHIKTLSYFAIDTDGNKHHFLGRGSAVAFARKNKAATLGFEVLRMPRGSAPTNRQNEHLEVLERQFFKVDYEKAAKARKEEQA